jgi:hypothetical protein
MNNFGLCGRIAKRKATVPGTGAATPPPKTNETGTVAEGATVVPKAPKELIGAPAGALNISTNEASFVAQELEKVTDALQARRAASTFGGARLRKGFG